MGQQDDIRTFRRDNVLRHNFRRHQSCLFQVPHTQKVQHSRVQGKAHLHHPRHHHDYLRGNTRNNKDYYKPELHHDGVRPVSGVRMVARSDSDFTAASR